MCELIFFFFFFFCKNVYIGGGFVFGDLQADANFCMVVRNRVGILVIDVDYRMSPGELLI